MFKKNSIYRIFIVLIFTFISLHIFVLDLKISNISLQENINPFYRFFFEFNDSIMKFDVIWVIFGIFIFDYYYNNYFLYSYKTKYKLLAFAIASILSLFIIMGISLNSYNDLRILYSSPAQIYKSIIFFFGYFIFFYITIIRLFKKGLNYDK